MTITPGAMSEVSSIAVKPLSLMMAIDGGGSGCRATLIDKDGNIIGKAKSGQANIATDWNRAYQNINNVIALAITNSSLPIERVPNMVVALAVAGAERAHYVDRLRMKLNYSRVVIHSDCAATIQGALQGENGIVASIGTGSFFVSQVNGAQTRVGGWGFWLSDQCSGALLGQSLLRNAVAAYDGLLQTSPLIESILAEFNYCISDLVTFSLKASPKDYAEFVPQLVKALEANDPTASFIMKNATDTLCKILDRLDAFAIQKICLMGGLGSTYAKLLPEAYQKLLAKPQGSLIDGIISLANKELE